MNTRRNVYRNCTFCSHLHKAYAFQASSPNFQAAFGRPFLSDLSNRAGRYARRAIFGPRP